MQLLSILIGLCYDTYSPIITVILSYGSRFLLKPDNFTDAHGICGFAMGVS